MDKITKTNIPEMMKRAGVRQVDVMRRSQLGNETINRIAHGNLNVTLKSFVDFCDAAGFDVREAITVSEETIVVSDNNLGKFVFENVIEKSDCLSARDTAADLG